MVTRAPPEFPGLIAASVWMKKLKSLMPTWVRARAETMPLVTVWPTPKGLPMASTRSPTSAVFESRSSTAGRTSPSASTLRMARSVSSSSSTSVAENSRRSERTTVISVAPAIT